MILNTEVAIIAKAQKDGKRLDMVVNPEEAILAATLKANAEDTGRAMVEVLSNYKNSIVFGTTSQPELPADPPGPELDMPDAEDIRIVAAPITIVISARPITLGNLDLFG